MTDHQRPDTIAGYTHPEKAQGRPRAAAYKTFTEGQKPKKKEVFGSVSADAQYASNQELKRDEEEEVLCPVCSQPPTKVCPCGYNDKKCEEGHIWYTSRDGKIKVGNPH